MAQLVIVAVIAIAAALLIQLLMPKPSARKQDPRDIRVSDSAYGQIISRGKGRFTVAGELVQAREIRIVKKKQKSGKGGGGGGSSGVTYQYFFTGAYAICEGPVLGIVRAWMDKKLVYDITGQSELDVKEGVTLRFALGGPDQTPDTMTTADYPVGERPGYINTVMMYVDDMNLEFVGNHIPNLEVEVDTESAPTGFGTTPNVTTADVNESTDDFDDRAFFIDYGREKIYAMFYSGVFQPQVSMREYDLNTLNELDVHDLTGIADGVAKFTGIDQKTGYLYGGHQDVGDEWAYVYDPATKTWITEEQHPFSQSVVEFDIQHTPLIRSPNGTYARIFSTDFDLITNVHSFPDMLYVSSIANPAPASVDRSGFRPTWMTGTLNSDVGDSPNWAGDTVWICWVSFANLFFEKWTLDDSGTLTKTSYSQIAATSFDGVGREYEKLGLEWCPYIDPSDGGIIMMIQTGDIGSGLLSAQPPFKYWVFKFDPGSDSIVWKNDVTSSMGTLDAVSVVRGGTRLKPTANGHIVLFGGFTNAWGYKCSDGTETQLLDSSWTNDFVDNYTIWDGYTNTLYTVYNDGEAFVLFRSFNWLIGYTQDSSILLGDILKWLFESAGLVDGVDFDVSGVSQSVWGIAISEETTLGALIEDILPIYFLILLQEDGKIVVRERNASAVATITTDEFMVNLGEEEDADPYVIELADYSELPIATEVSYINPRQQYESAEATWRRPIAPEEAVAHRTVLDVKTPLIMTEEHPQDAAYIWTYLPWNEQTRITFKLNWKYVWLSPGDPIDITFPSGSTVRARIQSCPIGQDWTVEVSAVFEDTGALQAAALSATRGGYSLEDILAARVDTRLFFVDTLLRDKDNFGNTTAIGYVFGTPLTAIAFYPGYELYRSDDGGANYTSLFGEVEDTPWGTITNTLGDPRDVNATDMVNTINVRMSNGIDELASITRDQLYASANAAIIYKNDGTYEIINYQTVTVVDADEVTLSILSRGKRGTDTMATGHTANETIVFLDTQAANIVSVPLDKLGVQQIYRGVTIGQEFDRASDTLVTLQGDSLKPWAPVQVTGVKDTPSAGDVTFSWVPRSRVGSGAVLGIWRHPENEDTTAYELDILASSGGAVVRTLTSTTTSVEYDTADRVTDGFDPMPASFFVRVYKMSDQVGRGYSYEVEVTV